MFAHAIILHQAYGTLLSLIRNNKKSYGLAQYRICKEICIYFKAKYTYLSLYNSRDKKFWISDILNRKNESIINKFKSKTSNSYVQMSNHLIDL